MYISIIQIHDKNMYISCTLNICIHGQHNVHTSMTQVMNSVSYLLINCEQTDGEYGIQPHPHLGQAQCSIIHDRLYITKFAIDHDRCYTMPILSHTCMLRIN